MPNRRKPPSEKRSKGLTLTLREREYEIIERLSKYMGLSKTDLLLSALKKQYSKSASENDHTNDYIALLKNQIDEYEERIKRDRETLDRLKEQYDEIVTIRARSQNEED